MKAARHPRVAGRIGRGFLLLVGFTHTDGDAQLTWMADKVIGLRLFPDADDKMNLSLSDIGGGLLVVSQFTLYGDAEKGRRPSFIDAARPEVAIPLYEQFLALLRARGVSVETGEFGAMMDVELERRTRDAVARAVSPSPRLILASQSPRRRELLALIGIAHDVRPANLDEAWLPGESPAAHAERLARELRQEDRHLRQADRLR